MRLCRLCKRLFSDDQRSCPDDKSSTVEVAVEPLPGELLERFPEREPLAQGATGTLYLIDRPGSIEDQLGPQLVLKVLAADLTADPAERARHRRDLRKQQGLIHAQLPAVLEEGEVDGRVWFTRAYVPATSLAVRLHQSGAFAPDAAISLIVQLSAALDGLHQLGLVHRDLKPGHVLLRAGQPLRVQLIDATLASPLVADNNARRGTPDYAAKEIIEGAASTARSDLYALGCLSYELIAGVPPFRRGSDESVDTQATLAAQRNFEPKSLPDLVPPVVRSAIASMLSKDARRRPFSAQQVRRSIEPLLAPVKPAARSGSLSALQREAAALRLTGPTAKPLAPTSYPDATVELDVKDLDEAIQASEEQDKRAGAAPRKEESVDDSSPTIALQSPPPPPAAPRSGVTATHTAERSGAVSSAGGTNPYPPVTAHDLERLDQEAAARKPPPARGDATQRTHVPSDDAPEPTSTLDAAFDSQPAPRPRTRTGTKFGIPAVGSEAAPSAATSTTAAESGAHAAAENARPAGGPTAGASSPSTIAAESGAHAAAENARPAGGPTAGASSPSTIAAESGAHAAAENARPAGGPTAGASSPSTIAAESGAHAAAENARPASSPNAGVSSPSTPAAAGGAVADAARAPHAATADASSSSESAANGGAREAAELPRRSRTGTKFGIPAVGSLPADESDTANAPAELPRRSRTGTKFGIPAVGAEATAAAIAPESQPEEAAATDDVPRRARSGTKFGLGPVSDADVEAAALAAELQREHGKTEAAPLLRQHGLQPSAAHKPRARRTRYIATPKALAESPRLLLWAAGGLAALIILLRVVLGPAERSRSSSIVVHVPEVATELPTPDQAVAEVSEQALIGGNITRVAPAPLAAAPARVQQQAPVAAAAPEPEADEQELAADESRKRVPTVSAVSVRGGLARAASTRQAASSGNAPPPDLKAQARELYKEGKYREAADAYQRAAQHNTTDAAAYAGLGGSLLATGDVRKAIAAYQKAVRLEPEVSGFQAALGRAYLKKGDRARARAAYSKALELDPNNQAARSGMASAKAR